MVLFLLAWLVRKQARHPAGGEGCWKGEAQRPLLAFCREYFALQQGCVDAARCTLAYAQQFFDIALGQFAAIQDRLQNETRLRGKAARLDLFFCPEKDAVPELFGLHKRGHEGNLIQADAKEVSRKSGEGFFTEMPSTIQIIAACLIAARQMFFVVID
ncbi:MAG: hypothetical protein B7Z11_06210, partial [Acidovorax sp. 32-64-7]